MENDRIPRQDEQEKVGQQRQDANRDKIADLPQKPVEKDEQVKGGFIDRGFDEV